MEDVASAGSQRGDSSERGSAPSGSERSPLGVS
jgi:hypothetical protein